MKIRMYECGFGDCFRLREENQVDLYVDFGIHTSSWSGIDKINRFDNIIADMGKDTDFLLTHYHDDHFNGAIYMATHTTHKFRDVYIPDVWGMPESIYITSLILLRGIITRSVILGHNTIIDFLKSICNNESRIHFISRGTTFHNNQYIALWPEKEYVAQKAQSMFEKIQNNLNNEDKKILNHIEKMAKQLNKIVYIMATADNYFDKCIIKFNNLEKNYRKVYNQVQYIFDKQNENRYNKNLQYKLTKFGNEISIVFQNYQAERNVLFTGDFGKKRNWLFIENNQDNRVNMHSNYEVIKLPHHGTNSYYHSFTGRIQNTSTLMIPNGYINHNWYVSQKYNIDSVHIGNRVICAHNTKCLGPICSKCMCIYPHLYFDI